MQRTGLRYFLAIYFFLALAVVVPTHHHCDEAEYHSHTDLYSSPGDSSDDSSHGKCPICHFQYNAKLAPPSQAQIIVESGYQYFLHTDPSVVADNSRGPIESRAPPVV